MLDSARMLEQALGSRLRADLRVAVAGEGAQPARLTRGERACLRRLDGARHARWLRGRSALRQVLGGADTAGLAFPHATVSLSHSGRWSVAVAVAAGLGGIGVDLQLECGPSQRTARLFLTPREQAWLERQTPEECAGALLRLWTVKEALFKADADNACAWFSHYAAAQPARTAGPARRSDTGRRFRYVSLAVPTGWISVALALDGRCTHGD